VRKVEGRPLVALIVVAVIAALLAACSASGGSQADQAPPSTDRPTTSPTTDSGPSTTGPSTTPSSTSLPGGEPDDAPDPDVDDVPDTVFPGQGDPRIDVSHYDVVVRADPGERSIEGTATLTLSARTADPLRAFTLDFSGPRVTSASVDDDEADVEVLEDGEIEVTPASPLEPDVAVELVIAYAGSPLETEFPSLGVPVGWQSDDDGGWFTMSEPDGTSSWVPVNEHPSDKATWTTTLDTPSDVTGVGNGRLTSREKTGVRKSWVWETDQPMAPYLVFAAVGAYDLVERDGPDGTQVVFAFPVDLPAEDREAFDELDAILTFFTEQFGPYPDDDTGAVVVPTALGLALETQTRPLFGLDSTGGATVAALAHELAHQWFGNAVTPATWSDLWLNESFATYADWLYQDHLGDVTLDELAELGRGSDLAVVDPEAAATFDPTIYLGGARALHALRLTVGDEDFAELLRRWFADNAGSSVTTDDFLSLAEDVADEELDDFADTWLRAPDQPDLPR